MTFQLCPLHRSAPLGMDALSRLQRRWERWVLQRPGGAAGHRAKAEASGGGGGFRPVLPADATATATARALSV